MAENDSAPRTIIKSDLDSSFFISTLRNQIPQKTTVNLPSTSDSSAQAKVAEANKTISQLLEKSEAARIERQKPLLIAVIALAGFQLVYCTDDI